MLHAGLDLSRRKVDVCLVSVEVEIVDEWASPPDADGPHGKQGEHRPIGHEAPGLPGVDVKDSEDAQPSAMRPTTGRADTTDSDVGDELGAQQEQIDAAKDRECAGSTSLQTREGCA
jgi:hypothetical protein